MSIIDCVRGGSVEEGRALYALFRHTMQLLLVTKAKQQNGSENGSFFYAHDQL